MYDDVGQWGSVIAEKQQTTGVVVADIDLSHLRQLRKMFPCNEHHVLKTEN